DKNLGLSEAYHYFLNAISYYYGKYISIPNTRHLISNKLSFLLEKKSNVDLLQFSDFHPYYKSLCQKYDIEFRMDKAYLDYYMDFAITIVNFQGKLNYVPQAGILIENFIFRFYNYLDMQIVKDIVNAHNRILNIRKEHRDNSLLWLRQHWSRIIIPKERTNIYGFSIRYNELDYLLNNEIFFNLFKRKITNADILLIKKKKLLFEEKYGSLLRFAPPVRNFIFRI
ncbi:hypothetical protein J7J62_04005, partial [bacterium]|nr:hypothetical protein [bacterium]